jgi:hypothetical protein
MSSYAHSEHPSRAFYLVILETFFFTCGVIITYVTLTNTRAGVDQGLVSITLTMKQFLSRFTRVDESISSNAGFWKG